MKMSRESVENLVADIRSVDVVLHDVVQGIRKIVRSICPEVRESVMYGGIMFSSAVPFCGVFTYKAHASLEFGRGSELKDPHHVLEGGGKARRHIKLQQAGDLKNKHVAEYVKQAHALAAF